MFDPSAPHIIILLIVVLLLFGSTRLPGAAKAIGKSMHIFKKSVKGMDDDEDKPEESGPTVTTVMTPNQRQLASPQTDSSQQAQIDALQRQLNDLQSQNTSGDAKQASDSAAAGRPDSRSY
ncbi:MAG: twin-arginine translocase TatA/TatE family subunit [Nocardiopsaceae bacterium]|jgi:sec-independent protein translocase protein TatA|nr:twin-arginine translocase TatA/TatE family subunit [Nocardiopsaceae bacterium]